MNNRNQSEDIGALGNPSMARVYQVKNPSKQDSQSENQIKP